MPVPSIRTSISLRLSLFVSCCLAIILAISEYADYRTFKTHLKDDIFSEQLTAATNMARSVQQKLNERTRFIDTLADVLGELDTSSPEILRKNLKQNLRLTTLFSGGTVIIRPDGEGLVTQSPPNPARRELLFTNYSWFSETLTHSKIVLSNAFRARDTGNPIIVIAKAIRTPKGKLIGVLAAPILLDDPAFLGPLYNAQYRLHGDFLLISRSEETFLAASDTSLLLKPTDKRGLNPQHDRNMDGFNGIAVATTPRGERLLTAVKDIPGTDWFLVARINAKDAFKPLHNRLNRVAISAIVLVGSMSALTFFSLYLFFRPLRQAAKLVRRMGKAGVPLHTLPKHKDDEIGDLVAGINALVATVQNQNQTLEDANRQLESLSRTDALTKVSNRRWFDHILDNRWRSHMRHGTPLSMIMVDIDFFKDYNDSYGHICGDQCLATVATTLQRHLRRPDDFLARYGGEEFAVLLSEDLAHAEITAERLRLSIADLNLEHTASELGFVTISLGVATCTPNWNTTTAELVTAADKALYVSKAHGRNCVRTAE